MRWKLGQQFPHRDGGSRAPNLPPLPPPQRITGQLLYRAERLNLGRIINPKYMNQLEIKGYFVSTLSKRKMSGYLDLNLFSLRQIPVDITLVGAKFPT